jgi:tetratricopeptide (TPR) repeat protein
MKTLILLLASILTLNFILSAQRNPTEDRQKTIDRIDREKVENPVRNPDQQREPIQPPRREKENPPIVINLPEPEYYPLDCNPHPPIPYDGPPPERPPHYPHMPPIIDNPPSLDELPLLEVYELGIRNLDLELYSEAIKCFNILLKDDPLNYEFYCFRGRAYHGLELFDKAIKDYQNAVKINKSYADGYYYLGLTEISLGNLDEAIVDFELAAEFGNDKAESLLKKYFKY